MLVNTQYTINRFKLKNFDLIKDINLCGLNIELKGRLKGIKRTRQFNSTLGKIKAQTIVFPVQTKKQFIQTKWGKFGLTTTLSHL